MYKTEVTLKKFFDQLDHEQNLCGNRCHHHGKLTNAQIYIEMTGFNP